LARSRNFKFDRNVFIRVHRTQLIDTLVEAAGNDDIDGGVKEVNSQESTMDEQLCVQVFPGSSRSPLLHKQNQQQQ
jgi:hypothetical protein